MDAYSEGAYQAMMARARFKDFWCKRCESIGVVRVKRSDNVPALALCDCETGQIQPWKLPSIKTLNNPVTQAVPYQDFHPGIKPLDMDELSMKNFMKEKISWWLEKIHTSEELWASDATS